MKILLPPTVLEAEKAGLCASCVAYRPDKTTPVGSHCLSTSIKRIENSAIRDSCSRKKAAEKMAERKERLLIEGLKGVWE